MRNLENNDTQGEMKAVKEERRGEEWRGLEQITGRLADRKYEELRQRANK